MKRKKRAEGLVIILAAGMLFLNGCSDADSVLPAAISEEMESVAAEVEANQDLAEFIEEITELGSEEMLEDAGLDVDFAPPEISFAPGGIDHLVIPRLPFPPELFPAGMVDREGVEITFHECGETRCRVERAVIPYTFPVRHYLDAAEIDVSLSYSSSLTGGSGDLNLTAPFLPDNPGASGPAAYVSGSYTVVRDLNGETTRLVGEGTGIISEDPEEKMREFAWTTTGFPESDLVCGETVMNPESEEEYIYADAGLQARETVRNYPDGVTGYHYRNHVRQGGLMTGKSLHLYRNGNTTSTTLELDPGESPHCPLDDSGTLNIVRTFTVPDDLPEGVTVPVREVTAITRTGAVETIESSLTLNTGEVLTRTLEREIISPADCQEWEADSPRPPLVAALTGDTYQGGTLDLTITRDETGIFIEGTRTHPDGSYTEIQYNRYRATVQNQLQAVRYDSEGALRTRIELTLTARQGRGKATVFDEAGDGDTLIIVFPCNGQGFWYLEGNPGDRRAMSRRKLFSQL